MFNDILNYLSPCDLAGFLRMTGSPTQKNVFPYQHYKSVKELENAKTFPPMQAFYSDLKSGLTCSQSEYESAKEMFENRINLPDDHDEKWSSMLNYLEFYNNQDVKPLIYSIKRWFEVFESVFGIDGFQKQSLASMAQSAMFVQYNQFSPLLHSLPPWQSDLLKKVRNNIVGGLVTCLHRAVILDGSDGPEASKIAPNGKPYKTIIPYDFNR